MGRALDGNANVNKSIAAKVIHQRLKNFRCRQFVFHACPKLVQRQAQVLRVPFVLAVDGLPCALPEQLPPRGIRHPFTRKYGFARSCQSLTRFRDFGGAETRLHQKIRPPCDAVALKLSFDANSGIARGLGAAR